MTDKEVVKGKNLEGSSVGAIIDEDRTNVVSLGSSKWYRKLLQIFGIGNKVEFTSVMVEVQGTTTNTQAIIREIELPSIEETQNLT